ncbi:PQQ-binding-like beta-propeller repeat protein [Sandarakinorhabdus sp.]|uniref:PQQ-like beta-propeller repeat protein n=1 Tax=Sandarakinorhabdus sp. TaxID=1916663 RepID=UPI00286DCC8D|nr:PQQ-binding-like beta-propeller repeat protein [Sandarakinorhabdus sp.]
MILSLALAGCGVFKKIDKKRTPTIGERIPILSFETKAEAESELKDVTIVLPSPQPNADWSQPGGSQAKSGGHVALGDNIAPVWSASIGSGSSGTARLNSAPVVGGGRVFTMDITGTIRAFDAKTGSVAWSHDLRIPKKSVRTAFGGGVSFGDGRVFAASGQGLAAALDAATGKLLWEKPLGEPLRGSPAVSGNRVFVLTQDNQLFAMNAETGDSLWNITGTVEVASILGAGAPAIALETVVAGFSSGELNALRAENGRTVWSDQLARTGRSTAMAALADIDASPVIDRGRVYAIGHGGRMVALELATGQRVWERNFAGTSTPWAAGEFIYIVTIEGEVLCLTRGEGKVRWVIQLEQFRKAKKKKGPLQWQGPILAGEKLWVTGSNQTMLAINPYNGKVERTIKLSGPAYLAPVVADNMLYLLTDDGKLTAYR